MTKHQPLKAPFPYFGGKSRVASTVWSALGQVDNYVEPFAGSAAMLLGRPGGAHGVETINDKDGFISNFWRAVKEDPEAVARHADWPVNENDLHARNYWMITEGARTLGQNNGDPDWYDTRIAGWWIWGACAWIGEGWCLPGGPWRVINGQLTHKRDVPEIVGAGVNRVLPHTSTGGQGINRKIPETIDPQYGRSDYILGEILGLSARLRGVRVASGDFQRVLGSGLRLGKNVGIFLDPPYAAADRRKTYAEDNLTVSDRARDWALGYAAAEGERARIAFCGYAGQSDDSARFTESGWRPHRWKATGGYGNRAGGRGRENAHREVIWFSPGCLDIDA